MRKTLLLALTALLVLSGCGHPKSAATAYTFAVIGDLPYSEKDLDRMGGWVKDINKADPAFTVHVGDVKTGPADCADEYFQRIRKEFDRFDGPLIYTPGDNDWTDCHLKKAGKFDPLERLEMLRALMFPNPGESLGQHPLATTTYDAEGFPENVTFSKGGVRFAVVHLVGSDNGLLPWEDLDKDEPTPGAKVEEKARTENAVRVITDAFTAAAAHHDRAVVICTQANLFRKDVRTDLLRPVVAELVRQAREFEGQVVLVNGDTHEYVDGDHPLRRGSKWLQAYGLDESADDLVQVVTDGDTTADKGWIRFKVAKQGSEPITWDLEPYDH